MEVRGFTSLSSRPLRARSSVAAVYLSRRSGRRRMTAGDGGIHQLELRPIACSWLIHSLIAHSAQKR